MVIEDEAPGGQAGSSSRIENYLGFPEGVRGEDLARRALIQATRFGAELLTQKATGIRTENNYNIVQLADGREVSCHACLIAVGVYYRRLTTPGVERLTGAGVYYGAAMTEAQACKDENVYHSRGGKLGRPGRYVLLQVRKKGNHAGKGRVACKQHVEIFNRSDCSHIEYRGQIAMSGGGSIG